MADYEFTKAKTFQCSNCESAAKIVVGDSGIESVFCPSCGTSVDGETARLMHDELFNQYVIQEGRNIMRREVNKTGIGRVPLTKVDNEFSDSRWPFTLILNDHG